MYLLGQSILYKWSITTSKFFKIQNVPTNGVTDTHAMNRSNKTVLLAIANAEKTTFNSSITVWKLINRTMLCLVQTIPASMPRSVRIFEIENQFYMAIAMSFDPVLQSTRAMSVIYKLNNLTQWELLQQIPTACAVDLAYFKGGMHHFLAIANERTRTLQTQTSQILGVEFYQFISSKGLFALMYAIRQPFSISLQPFAFKTSRYMAVAIKNLGVKVFKFKAHIGYEEIQFIPQAGITHLTAFTIERTFYMTLGSRLTSDDNNKYLKELTPRILEAKVSGENAKFIQFSFL